jgi:hypothetical protein
MDLCVVQDRKQGAAFWQHYGVLKKLFAGKDKAG